MLSDLNILLAFGAGFLNFISPCTLPLYPAFISYITGMSLDELQGENKSSKRIGLLHTIFFLLGFSIIFIFLGYGSSLVGWSFFQYKDLLRQVGAILIVIFGLIIIGVLSPKLLMQEKRLVIKNRPTGYFGSLLIGLAFAAGWTPCSGPITGAVFMMASQNPNVGVFYMIVYVLGFAIPFLLLSQFITKLGWIRKYSTVITKVGGYMMVVLGIILFFDGLTYITIWLSPYFDGFTGF